MSARLKLDFNNIIYTDLNPSNILTATEEKKTLPQSELLARKSSNSGSELKTEQAAIRTFYSASAQKIRGPIYISSQRERVSESVPNKALRIARNICCYAKRVRGEVGELAYQMKQPRTEVEKAFWKEILATLSSRSTQDEDVKNDTLRYLSEKARDQNISKTFSNAALDLIESNDITSLTALLYDYLHKEDSKFDFPVSIHLEKAIENPSMSKHSWLLLEDEPEMVESLLENPTEENFEALTRIVQNMTNNETPIKTIRNAFRKLINCLPVCHEAPRICPIEKIAYYRLAKEGIDNAVRVLVKPGIPSILLDIKDAIQKMYLWDASHVFTSEIRQGSPSGYHVLSSPDVHHEEDKLILLKDPVVHERGTNIAFYEVQYLNQKNEFCRSMKYSSFYSNTNRENLACGLNSIVTAPINNIVQMARANELTFYGFHNDLDDSRILSQVFVNFDQEGNPVIVSCFPVPYRDMAEESAPSSPPRIVRRSISGLMKGSPIKGDHESPTKALKTAVSKHVSPYKKKGVHRAKRKSEIDDKMDRMIERLPLKRIPSNPDLGNYLFTLPYSSIRKASNIREFLLNAVNQVERAEMEDQLYRPISPHDTPDSYADVPMILCVPRSVMHEIVEEILEKTS